MTSSIIEETAELTFSSFLGSLGGQLGLLLGMSFLSFLELVEILFTVIWEQFFVNLVQNEPTKARTSLVHIQ